MSRKYLVSPDGNAIAVRSDQENPEAWNAWGVMHAQNGGHWASTSQLVGWFYSETTEQSIEEPVAQELD